MREVFGRFLMGRLPPSGRVVEGGEEPAGEHDGIEGAAEGDGGEADQGAHHPGVVTSRFDYALRTATRVLPAMKTLPRPMRARITRKSSIGTTFLHAPGSGWSARGNILTGERNLKIE